MIFGLEGNNMVLKAIGPRAQMREKQKPVHRFHAQATWLRGVDLMDMRRLFLIFFFSLKYELVGTEGRCRE